VNRIVNSAEAVSFGRPGRPRFPAQAFITQATYAGMAVGPEASSRKRRLNAKVIAQYRGLPAGTQTDLLHCDNDPLTRHVAPGPVRAAIP